MKNFFYPAFLFAFLFCGCGNTKSDDAKNDSTKKQNADTLKNTAVIPADTLSIAEHLGGDTIQPKIDTLVKLCFNTNLEKNKKRPISVKDAKKYLRPLLLASGDNCPYSFDSFFSIDSLKGKPSDEDPIGSIVEVKFNLIDSVFISKSCKAICWSLYFESYPACPFSAGTYYLLTTFDLKGKQIGTTILGENTGGGDAPAEWSGDKAANLFTDGSFKEISVDSTQEDPDSAWEVTKNIYRGKIESNGMIRKTRVSLVEKEGR